MGRKNTEQHQYEYKQLLTVLMSRCSLDDMPRLKDIVSGLSQQTSRKATELERDLKELDALREPWQRYAELSKQIESKKRVVEIGYALLFSLPLKTNLNGDAYSGPDSQYMESSEPLGLSVEDLDLSQFSLWRVIREVVRQTAEIRVYELEAHLKSFGLKKATRPAIESALATHPREFRIVKRGREKFVSLK